MVGVICEVGLCVYAIQSIEISNAIIDERVLTYARVCYCLCRSVIPQVYIVCRPGYVDSYCFSVAGSWST